MAVTAFVPRRRPTATELSGTAQRAAANSRLNWAMTAATTWFVGGVFLDGWAHNNIPQLESFFTPWHAVLYSGYGVSALLVVAIFLQGIGQGVHWRKALPAGYGLALAGSGIFLAGGLADMAWHAVFGIEASVDALFSPSHLLLALGGLMMQIAPFRAWWLSREGNTSSGLLKQLPAFISLAYVWSVLGFFTQYAHPFLQTWASAAKHGPADPFYGQALGTLSIIVQTALLAGIVLLPIRRRALPPGALTLMFGINGLLINAMHGQPRFVLTALAAGVCADVLYLWLRPSMQDLRQLHLFAFLLPLPLYMLYFAALAPSRIIWSVHLWTGSIAMAGVTAWLLSFLLAPPSVPAGDQ